MYLVPLSFFTGSIVVVYILLLLSEDVVSFVTAIFVVKFLFFIDVDAVGDIDDDDPNDDDSDGDTADVEFEDDIQGKDCDTDEEASDADGYDIEFEDNSDMDGDCVDCFNHADVEPVDEEGKTDSDSDVDPDDFDDNDAVALAVDTDAVDDNDCVGSPEDSVDDDIISDVDDAVDDNDDCMLFVSSVKDSVACVVDKFDEDIEVDCEVDEEDRDIGDSEGFIIDPQVESSMLLSLFVDTRRKREYLGLIDIYNSDSFLDIP